MQTLTVALDDRSYPIHIGDGVLSAESLRELLIPHIRGRQVFVITNERVDSLFGAQLRTALSNLQVDLFMMQDGERYKNLESFTAALDALMAKRHNRTTCVVALGGGVVGDLAGFVAATFQRGVDFIQIPTTLLSQVDSSVGGKTAVNHPAGKNMIGAFYQPKAVLIDTAALNHLPAREYAAGLAEIVKYGVIADAELFAWLEANVTALNQRDSEALQHVIQRSCAIKAEVVAADERETGLRAILNFGHTFGHAVENLAGYGTWLHGEAVAVGMVMAGAFSSALGRLPAADVIRLSQLLSALQLPVSLHEQGAAAPAVEDMLQAMGMDKKVSDGRLRFIVADRIGAVSLVDDYPHQVLADVLANFCQPPAD
ncbi:MAG: 3-dehydroquinate synthase [Pseudomonadota bacterium]